MRTGLSWLDVKLGLRMLAKHPGLSLVGGLGMAVAIAIGAGFFAFYHSYLHSPLPLEDGDRVVGIRTWDAARNGPESRILHDFATWREELRSVEELSAFRPVQRNLTVPGGAPEPVPVAEMTASGFRVARVAPLLGRYLVAGDEREGATPVVVIGFEVWQRRFRGDPGVVGREVRLGGEVHTVVGVMPEGFAFPTNFGLWAPLRLDPADYHRLQGPRITVFGRLAPGASLAQAQAELSALGARTAAAFPETHERLRPRVSPYTALWVEEDIAWEFRLVQLLITLLLVVIAVNVAVLVYARTATRLGEIAVRSALGASRRRIVVQLFVEALVLSSLAAGLGLLLARLGLDQLDVLLPLSRTLPFWMDFGISSATLLYVAGLAVLAAVIVGVVPALQATGPRMQTSLRQLGGGTGMQLGRTWTVLIVSQVAFAVASLPAAVAVAWSSVRHAAAEPGFPADEFLAARVSLDRETPPSAEAAAYRREFDARFGDRLDELVRRLEAEPAVSAVTYASGVPGYDAEVFLEIDDVPAPGGAAGHRIQMVRVEPGFFEAFGVPVLAGRGLHPGDAGDAATAVVVSRSFARELLGGGNVLGRRIRTAGLVDDDEGLGSDPGPWYEIVGVVSDLPANPTEPGQVEARVYHAAAPGRVHPVTLAVRTRGVDAAAFAPRLRELAAAVDPTLELREVRPLGEIYREKRAGLRVTAWGIALATLSVLLLSAAGIYALMSFTVARRRKEIGIRSALGADPGQIIRAIFSRALRQVGLGLVAGLGVAALLDAMAGGELTGGEGALVLPLVAALVAAVGLLAALGPARRGLRIEPMEALREE